MRLLPLIALMACEPMPATGDPLSPVPSARPAAAPASGPVADVPSSVENGFDFDEDAGGDEEGGTLEDLDPAALLALSQGKEPPPPSNRPVPVPAPTPAPVVPVPVPLTIAPPAMRVWDPAVDLKADWGVRLVSTLVDTQPPRAVLGLPDGTEVVVKPGTFLPEQRLVVMAVGRNAVQVSRVVPEGYQARVETHTLSSLFPSQAVLGSN